MNSAVSQSTSSLNPSSSIDRAWEVTYVNNRRPRNGKGHLIKFRRIFRGVDAHAAKFQFMQWRQGEFVQYGRDFQMVGSAAEVLPHASAGSLAKLNSPRRPKHKMMPDVAIAQRNAELRKLAGRPVFARA